MQLATATAHLQHLQARKPLARMTLLLCLTPANTLQSPNQVTAGAHTHAPCTSSPQRPAVFKNPALADHQRCHRHDCHHAPACHAIEEPAYTVVQKTDVFEVRQYAPYLVAEVIVPGPASEAGSQGFSLLGGYIFGKNKGERKLEMTAPVTQTPLEPAPPVKLEMTAPVTQAPAPGGFAVQFVMPKGYTLATLPEPLCTSTYRCVAPCPPPSVS